MKFKALFLNEAVKDYTCKHLEQDKWSPEIISVKGKEDMREFVSHESVYKWIWHSKRSNQKQVRDDCKLNRI